jgi:hypothetical protein
VDGDIMEILRLTHLDELFVITRTMKEATRLLSEGEAGADLTAAQPVSRACHEPAGEGQHNLMASAFPLRE